MFQDKLGIQGQGLLTGRSQDGSLGPPSTEPSPSPSRPSTASGDSPGGALGTITMPPEAVNVIESVISMNKTLEQQIDALRMRLTVEAKNHDSELHKMKQKKDDELNKKEEEINDLKDSLVSREDRITTLVREGNEKEFQIKQKEKEINDLKELVKQTEHYTNQLQKQVGKLKSDKNKVESDVVTKEQDDEVKKLRSELFNMKDKISSLEKELTKARTVIDKQSVQIRGLETENSVISDRFKEELEKASRAMRSEVERMREVMKQQYMEMRNLREQNIEISCDVRDIKDILLKNTVKPEPEIIHRNTEKLDVNNFRSPRPMPSSPNFGVKRVPVTSRQVQPPKNANATVRKSMPAMPTVKKAGTGQANTGLPPISKPDQATGKWLPVGSSGATRQSNFRPSKTLKK